MIGIVVYTGMDTKIMKNLKKPLYKMSNLMKMMNKMLYSVFAFQLLLIAVFAGLDVKWINDNQLKHFYLKLVSSLVHLATCRTNQRIARKFSSRSSSYFGWPTRT